MTKSESAPTNTNDSPSPSRSWPLMIAICFVAIIFGLNLVDFGDLEGGPIVRMLSDRAFVNVFSLSSAGIAFAFVIYWFYCTSRLSRTICYGTTAVAVIAIIVLVMCFRIEAVRGDLRPEFRWRWAKAPDRELLPIKIDAKEIDLKTTSPADFPQFLGPNRSLYLLQRGLSWEWKNNPPKQKWSTKIGAGWSAFSAVNGYAVTQEQRGDEELVTCYDIETGDIVWSNSIAARHETTIGYVGPRGTPTIFHGDVYALGATGILQRIKGSTGKTVWKKNLLDESLSDLAQEAESIAWGRAASPLVVENLVVVPVGGPKKGKKISLTAYDIQTGEKKWGAGDRQASYSSPKNVTLCDLQMILSVNEDSVSAHEIATGKQLWEHEWPGSSTGDANCSEPMVIDSDIVMLSKGYGEGAMALRLTRSGAENDSFKVEELWKNNRALRTKFTNVALDDDDFAYGLSDGLLQCVNGRTGDIEWKAPKRFGNGQVLGVDQLLLVQSEDGEITLVRLTAERYQPLGSFQGLDPHSGACWNNMCLYGNLLLLRNSQQAACWELPLARANAAASKR